VPPQNSLFCDVAKVGKTSVALIGIFATLKLSRGYSCKHRIDIDRINSELHPSNTPTCEAGLIRSIATVA